MRKFITKVILGFAGVGVLSTIIYAIIRCYTRYGLPPTIFLSLSILLITIGVPLVAWSACEFDDNDMGHTIDRGEQNGK